MENSPWGGQERYEIPAQYKPGFVDYYQEMVMSLCHRMHSHSETEEAADKQQGINIE